MKVKLKFSFNLSNGACTEFLNAYTITLPVARGLVFKFHFCFIYISHMRGTRARAVRAADL